MRTGIKFDWTNSKERLCVRIVGYIIPGIDACVSSLSACLRAPSRFVFRRFSLSGRSCFSSSSSLATFPVFQTRHPRWELQNLKFFFPAPAVDSFSSRVGYFSNESGFSVESSLQRISLNLLLWKRNDSSVVL